MSVNIENKKIENDWISEEEAAFMGFDDRPAFYKSKDDILENLKQKFDKNSSRSIDDIQEIEEFEKKGIDVHQAFGGLGGGELELLLYSPNKGDSAFEISDLVKSNEDYSKIPNLGYFGQPGVGWMNLNDVIGSGVQTYNSCDIPERKFVYTGNKPTEFKYFPGESLVENEISNNEEMSKKKKKISEKFLKRIERRVEICHSYQKFK